MFNSLEKAIELINKFRDYSTESFSTESYMLRVFELQSICEDYIVAHKECEAMSAEIQSLRNYIRLLEKENQELKEGK